MLTATGVLEELGIMPTAMFFKICEKVHHAKPAPAELGNALCSLMGDSMPISSSAGSVSDSPGSTNGDSKTWEHERKQAQGFSMQPKEGVERQAALVQQIDELGPALIQAVPRAKSRCQLVK